MILENIKKINETIGVQLSEISILESRMPSNTTRETTFRLMHLYRPNKDHGTKAKN